MVILVTGAAGFIGSHVSQALLDRGDTVLGLDNLNAYYDVNLKKARLRRLTAHPNFRFALVDISDRIAVDAVVEANRNISGIVHLAAQAGVRYSLINPFAYITTNIMGHTVMLEGARKLPALRHFVYASSSSVYGSNKDLPFGVSDRVDQPNSLYAASKRADELISQTYAHLYKIPQTGLRFFTVYGPWGRPDMAAYIFTSKIVAGQPIDVFNQGEMWRDFTYIDDIVAGVVSALDHVPQDPVPHRVYNLGNHRSEKLTDYIHQIEKALGKTAMLNLCPMQMGDVAATYADIEASERDLGFRPRVTIEEGIPRFVEWYRAYHDTNGCFDSG